MPQDIVTFRPRAGATATVGAGAVTAVAIPAGTRVAHVVCTLTAGRVAVGTSASAPASDATNYGYLVANVPITLKTLGETYLYVGSTVASNVFYITFGN